MREDVRNKTWFIKAFRVDVTPALIFRFSDIKRCYQHSDGDEQGAFGHPLSRTNSTRFHAIDELFRTVGTQGCTYLRPKPKANRYGSGSGLSPRKRSGMKEDGFLYISGLRDICL